MNSHCHRHHHACLLSAHLLTANNRSANKIESSNCATRKHHGVVIVQHSTSLTPLVNKITQNTGAHPHSVFPGCRNIATAGATGRGWAWMIAANPAAHVQVGVLDHILRCKSEWMVSWLVVLNCNYDCVCLPVCLSSSLHASAITLTPWITEPHSFTQNKYCWTKFQVEVVTIADNTISTPTNYNAWVNNWMKSPTLLSTTYLLVRHLLFAATWTQERAQITAFELQQIYRCLRAQPIGMLASEHRGKIYFLD